MEALLVIVALFVLLAFPIAVLCHLASLRSSVERTNQLLSRVSSDLADVRRDVWHAEKKSHAESAETKSHAENAETKSHAESAETKSHAESAENAEAKSHAESAENAETKSHAESAKSAEMSSLPPSERGVARSAGGSTPCGAVPEAVAARSRTEYSPSGPLGDQTLPGSTLAEEAESQSPPPLPPVAAGATVRADARPSSPAGLPLPAADEPPPEPTKFEQWAAAAANPAATRPAGENQPCSWT